LALVQQIRERKNMKILVATDGSDFSTAAIDASANVVANSAKTAFKIV